jgi:hypothetical protein
MKQARPVFLELVLFPAGFARAQKSPAHEAVLELKVAAADLVVRGTVAEAQRHEAGNSHEVTVTVKVLETIKGKSKHNRILGIRNQYLEWAHDLQGVPLPVFIGLGGWEFPL